MTTQEKIKALAELDGCEDAELLTDIDSHIRIKLKGVWITVNSYLESYDAIIPLIQKQPDRIQLQIFQSIPCKPYAETPAQLADALLIATRRMKV